MKLTVFKPNPNNSGGLVNFRIANTKNNKKDVWEKTLFAEFIPQKSWSESNKTGSFDADKRRTVAINIAEAGEIIFSMKNNVPFQNFHQSGEKSCWVKFAPFEKKRSFGRDGDKGFWEGTVTNYAIGYSEKGKGVNIPLSPGEAVNFKILLESYIKESMAIDAKEEDKKFKKKDVPKQESKPVKDEVDEMFDDEDDVPFG